MFDPFDPKHAVPRRARRRTREEMDEAERVHRESIDADFRMALNHWGWPDEVEGRAIMVYLCFTSEEPALNSEGALRRNMEASMARLGYVKRPNPRSKDGRWCVNGLNTFLYARADVLTVVR